MISRRHEKWRAQYLDRLQERVELPGQQLHIFGVTQNTVTGMNHKFRGRIEPVDFREDLCEHGRLRQWCIEVGPAVAHHHKAEVLSVGCSGEKNTRRKE